MYESIILAHNSFRWLVLGTGLWLIRCLISNRKQDHLSNVNYYLWAFNQVFIYQIGFGLTLYLGVSPIPKMGIQNPELILNDSFVRFWTIIHGPLMLVALCIFHFGRARAKNKESSSRNRILLKTMIVTMVIILSANPWPFLSFGRPLLRLIFWEF